VGILLGCVQASLEISPAVLAWWDMQWEDKMGQKKAELVMGLGQKFLTRVRSIFCGSGRVGSSFMVWV